MMPACCWRAGHGSGWWSPGHPGARTLRQREFKQRRKDQGYHSLRVFLPGAVLDALHTEKRSGEAMAALIARLLNGARKDS